MDIRNLSKRDKLAARLLGYRDALHAAEHPASLADKETALEWLNSSHGRKAAYLARQMAASRQAAGA